MTAAAEAVAAQAAAAQEAGEFGKAVALYAAAIRALKPRRSTRIRAVLDAENCPRCAFRLMAGACAACGWRLDDEVCRLRWEGRKPNLRSRARPAMIAP